MSSFLAFLLALASSLSSTANDPARVYARPKTLRAAIEVHFYKADELASSALPSAVAKYSLVARNQQGDAHGSYARLRIGPRDLAKAERLRMNGGDARMLREGDELVLFAINHATGYAGMKRVTVPAYVANSADAIPTIVGDIKLFPPEIEVIVERQLTANGVPSPTGLSKIRESGAATRQDSYLKLSTRWRVRLAPAIEDDIVDGGRRVPPKPDAREPDPFVDAGHFATDNRDAGSTDGGAAALPGVSPLLDRGAFGTPLERPCADLDVGATARERLDCLNDEYTLTDVPAGVPSLAARMVHLSGAASTDQVFQVRGGPAQQALHVARETSTSTILPLENGLHLVHVVGRPMRNADTDGDGVLSAAEAEAGTTCSNVEGATPAEVIRKCGASIIPSDAVLVAGAPDFRDDPALRGFPSRSLAIKAVYDARLRPEDGAIARRVPSFDTTREHRFRVLSIENPETSMTKDGEREVIAERDKEGQLEEGIDAVTLSLGLDDIGSAESVGRDLTRPGNYGVRLGTDEIGLDCKVTTTSTGVGTYGLSGSCEGSSLDEVISAADILYLEMFQSGNSDNVLYRHNLYGTKARRDFLVAGSANTAEKSTKDVDPSSFAIKQVPRASTAKLNQALFFIDPARLKTGIVRMCLDEKCELANTILKEFNVTAYNATEGFTIAPRVVDGEVDQPVEALTFLPADVSQWFQLMLPPELSKMPGSTTTAKPFFVRYLPNIPPGSSTPALPPTSLPFRAGEGRYETRSAFPAGQMTEAGIVIADGRLVRSYSDLELPDLGVSRGFVRFYDNGRNEPSPLGTGWSHNFEGSIYESRRGRYQVVLGGQGYDFPTCSGTTTPTMTCQNDKAHNGKLTVTVVPHASDPARYASWSATFTDDDGVIYKFTRDGVQATGLGRRRLLLTLVDDGIDNKPLVLHYDGDENGAFADDDHVDSVTRVDSWTLSFSYDRIDEDTRSRLPIPIAITRYHTPRLTTVEAKLTSTTNAVVATIKFDHDLAETISCGEPGATMALPDVRYGQLLKTCRSTRVTNDDGTFGAISRDQLWTYAYAAIPNDVTGAFDKFAAGNELFSEKLELPLSSSPLVHKSDWERGFKGPHVYAHMSQSSFETVTRANLPGLHAAVDFKGGSALSRPVTHLDGTVSVTQLNKYGNVTRLTDADGTESAEWLSDSDTESVQPARVTTRLGDRSKFTYEDDGSLTKVEVEQVSSNIATTNGFKVGTSITLSEKQARTTAPQLMTVSSGASSFALRSTHTAAGTPTASELVGVPSNDEHPLVNADEIVVDVTRAGEELYAADFDAEWGLPMLMVQRCVICVPQPAPAPSNLDTKTMTLAYDALGRVSKLHSEEKNTTSSARFDALGRPIEEKYEGGPNETWKTTYSRNGFTGDVTVVRRLVGGTASTTTTIDKYGRAVRVVDNVGREDVIAYAGATSRPVKLSRIAEEVNADGERRSVERVLEERTYRSGNLATVTTYDLNAPDEEIREAGDGPWEKKTYDALSRVTEVEHSTTSSVVDKDSYEYDEIGLVKRICQGDLGSSCRRTIGVTWTNNHTVQTLSTTNGLFEETTFDARQYARQIRSGYSTGDTDDVVQSKTYDVEGRVVGIVSDVRNGAGTLRHASSRSFNDATLPRTTSEAETVQRAGLSTLTGTTSTELDLRHRPHRVTKGGGLYPASTTTWTFNEDAARRVVGVSFAATGTTLTGGYEAYDGFGRTVFTTTKTAGVSTDKRFEYLGFGQVRELGTGPQRFTTSDGRGRVLRVQQLASGVGVEDIFEFDALDRVSETHRRGDTITGRYERQFDDGGRPIREKYLQGGVAVYEYERKWTDGRHATVTDPITLELVATEEYDGRAQLIMDTFHVDEETALVTRHARDARSLLVRSVLPTGDLVEERRYEGIDGLDRLRWAATPNGDLLVYGYETDEQTEANAPQALVRKADADRARSADAAGVFAFGNPGYCESVTEPDIAWMARFIEQRRLDGGGMMGERSREVMAESEYGEDRLLWPCDVRLLAEQTPETAPWWEIGIEAVGNLTGLKIAGGAVAAGAGMIVAERWVVREVAEGTAEQIAKRLVQNRIVYGVPEKVAGGMRATGAFARVAEIVKSGRRARGVDVSGHVAGITTRGHLIGRMFRGSNAVRNLAPLYEGEAKAAFDFAEQIVAARVRSGEVVSFSVIPEYIGEALIPSRFNILANSDESGVFLDVFISNVR